MATCTAQSSGNWADVWDVLPITGDLINLNGYTVTIPTGYTTAVIATGSGSGGTNSIGPAGSTLDIKSGGKLRYSGVLVFRNGRYLRTQGGATLEASPALDNMYGCYVDIYDTWTIYDASTSSKVLWTRSGANRPYNIASIRKPQTVEYMSFSSGGRLRLYGGSSAPPGFVMRVRYCDVYGGSSLSAEGTSDVTITSCRLWGGDVSIYTGGGSCVRVSNCTIGRDAAGNTDSPSSYAISANAARIFGSRIYSLATALAAGFNSTPSLGILDLGYTDADGDVPALGARGSAARLNYYGQMSYAVGAGKWTLTPSSNLIEFTPLRWPDDDVTGLLSAPIPAAAGQAVSLSVTVTPNASQTADSVRLVLDPDNMYGCYAVSAQATPAGDITQLTAAGTVAAGVSNVLIPWRLEINAYAAGGVVDVESAAVAVDGVAHTLDQRSMRWIAPAATGGPATGGRRRCDFAGVRYAT